MITERLIDHIYLFPPSFARDGTNKQRRHELAINKCSDIHVTIRYEIRYIVEIKYIP